MEESTRHDSFGITFSYPDGNKGKDIRSKSKDLLDYAVYNYRLEGEYLGRNDYTIWTFGDEEYASLQSYSIHIQSKLKKPCSLLQFLRFWDDCVDITGKVVIGYMDLDAEKPESRKRYSSGLKEGVITKKITDVEKRGKHLILDFGGIKAKINIERALKELLLSIDNDNDYKVDQSKYNYEWQIEAGDSDVHSLEGNLEEYILENFNTQESNSNDFLSDRKASLRGLFRKVANDATEIPISDFGKAKIDLYQTKPDGSGYFDVTFLGNFADTPDLKGLEFRVLFDSNKNIEEVTFVSINQDASQYDYTSTGNALEVDVRSNIYNFQLKMPNITNDIGGRDTPELFDSSNLISAASYYDASAIPETEVAKKEVKIYCISQGNINKFPEVKAVVSEQIMSDYPDADTIDKAIRKFQKEKLGFSGRNVDGILGPKSYGEMISYPEDSAIANLYLDLFAAFAKDAGHSENLEIDYIEAFYDPKFISCSGTRRSRGRGVAQRQGESGGQGAAEYLGSLTTTTKKDCKEKYKELISTPEGKEKVRNALLADRNFMYKYKNSSPEDQNDPMGVLAEHIKNLTTPTTAECYIFEMIKQYELTQRAKDIGTLPSGRDGGYGRQPLPAETKEQIEGCSGEDWTEKDIYGLLKAIITGKTTGLNIGQKGGAFVAQVLNPNKLKNKFKALLRKRKKGLDFPFFRSNKFYLKIIEDMSADLAKYMNAFVKQDAQQIRELLGKKEYEYLSDEKASPSIGRYCKTGFKRQDRSRLFMGFTDLVNKNPMAIDSLAKKYIVKGYKDLDRMAPNLREFDTTDVRYNQDTWDNEVHDKTSGNILNDLVKLSSHLDNINEKAFSDRIEDIILETLGEK